MLYLLYKLHSSFKLFDTSIFSDPFNVPNKIMNNIKSAIFAGIVGDALGVPVQSSTREELELCSVKNMLGYGRFDLPAGTWSDDTSMVLCTMESLCERYDISSMASLFCKWIFQGHWTPFGSVFDYGLTTFLALESIENDQKSPHESGLNSPDDNGNGSLMRILPAALFFRKYDVAEFLDRIHEISAITHAHPRSMMGCGIYSLLVRSLCVESDKQQAFSNTISIAKKYYGAKQMFEPEMKHFDRILSGDLTRNPNASVVASGYIIETLEAAIWSFMRQSNTRDVLLEAVNLGLDTDTTGMVAGGLGGLYYGINSVPPSWIDSIARRPEIDSLIDRFAVVCCN